jgi:hypothetical protein
VVSSKWIYKIKHAAIGSVENFKEIFVARGFTQKEGIDYEETFSHVAKYTSIRTIIALAFVCWLEATPDGCKNNILEWKY